MSCPEQYIPHQPTEALACANETRLAAAALRQRVATGELTLAQAINHPDAASLTITRLLEAQPHWGKVRAKACLAALAAALEPIGALRRVRDLSPRQRALVIRQANPLSETEERRLLILERLGDGTKTSMEIGSAIGRTRLGGTLPAMERAGLICVAGWLQESKLRWVRMWKITPDGTLAARHLSARWAA